MTDTDLRKGDIVILNSGGPSMLIERIDGDKATCSWPRSDGMMAREVIPVECLTLIKVAP